MKKINPLRKAVENKDKILADPRQYKSLLICAGIQWLQNLPSVDSREKDVELTNMMLNFGWQVATLNFGDYGYKDIIACERKSDDLLESLFSGKLFQQLEEIRDNYEHAYLVIDRNLNDVLTEAKGRGIPDNVIYGLVASCCVRGFTPLFLGDRINTGQILHWLFAKHYDGKDRSVKTFLRSVSAEDVLVSRTAQIPGVTLDKAALLVKIFGTENKIIDFFYMSFAGNSIGKILSINAGTIEKCVKLFEEIL